MVAPKAMSAQRELATDIACCIAVRLGFDVSSLGLVTATWLERQGRGPVAFGATVRSSLVLIVPADIR